MTAAIPRLWKFGTFRAAEFRKRCAEIRLFSFQHGMFLGGLGAISYGAWLVYHPLGFVVGGWLAVRVALLIEGERR